VTDDHRILLCCDLDRTVLPNGDAPENPEARPVFREVARRSEVTIAYASGRSRDLLLRAISEYALPEPAFAIGDVGSTIYAVARGRWRRLDDWHDEIAPDWHGRTAGELENLIGELRGLELQEREKQGRFKLSYYADLERDSDDYLKPVHRALEGAGVSASLIWSVDETVDIGLLDILPRSATKRHAVEFLLNHLGLDETRMVYAGDSGNDLPVLTSGLQAVLVANAREEVRRDARRQAADADRLYLAVGGFQGLNGNYAAGVLEGLAHFLPETETWIRNALTDFRAS
jgi:HAD superfamily hydrolase (TIGR01484 family)